ncbi:MAG: hypothetical protein ACRDSL_27495 [Pseudonocardiaceae bacterium]
MGEASPPSLIRDTVQDPKVATAVPTSAALALIAVKHRLRKLGEDIAETERTRIRAVQRIGELLGEARPGRPETSPNANVKNNDDSLSTAERNQRHQARLLAAVSGSGRRGARRTQAERIFAIRSATIARCDAA